MIATIVRKEYQELLRDWRFRISAAVVGKVTVEARAAHQDRRA